MKLIPRKYTFAFVLILIGQMVSRIYVLIDTSPQTSLSLSPSKVINSEIILFRFALNSVLMVSVVIQRSWYRAQKPLKPGNTKNIRKITKSPTLGRENTIKIQKKYEMAFSYFFCIFFVFSGPDPGWGILYFLYFFVFPGLRGF